MLINLHSTIKSSRVNGPGDRFVIWTQGCRKMCKNCYNPETWSHYRNNLIDIDLLVEEIKNSSTTGVTISGGDPFEQPEELFYLLGEIKQLDLSDGVIVFSGYTIDEIRVREELRKSLDYIDVLIDGLYIDEKRITNGLAGSSNQEFHFLTDKISRSGINIDQEVEIHSLGDLIQITGFPLIDKINMKLKGISFM
jgi:anaerobic ribonucleoside-triphosphate reductase activating protein